MKIVTCMKIIPDPSLIEFDIQKEEMKGRSYILNPPDSCAFEEALRIREKYGGEVTTIAIAPPAGEGIIKKTLLDGADRAIRVWSKDLAVGIGLDIDVSMTTAILTEILIKTGFDLVLCGHRSKAGSREFKGIALASSLQVPIVTRVVGIEFSGKKEIIVHKKLEKGMRETYKLKLPAVITVDEGINQPRYVPLFSRTYWDGVGKKVEILEPPLSHIVPLVKLVRVDQPKPRTKVGKKLSGLSMMEKLKVLRGETGGKKEMVSGSPVKAAEKIIEKLKEWYWS